MADYDYEDKLRGAFYGLALGDALGGPHEFRTGTKLERYSGRLEFPLVSASRWQGRRSNPPGSVTDDTEMTLTAAGVVAGFDFGVLGAFHTLVSAGVCANYGTMLATRDPLRRALVAAYMKWANGGTSPAEVAAAAAAEAEAPAPGAVAGEGAEAPAAPAEPYSYPPCRFLGNNTRAIFRNIKTVKGALGRSAKFATVPTNQGNGCLMRAAAFMAVRLPGHDDAAVLGVGALEDVDGPQDGPTPFHLRYGVRSGPGGWDLAWDLPPELGRLHLLPEIIDTGLTNDNETCRRTVGHYVAALRLLGEGRTGDALAVLQRGLPETDGVLVGEQVVHSFDDEAWTAPLAPGAVRSGVLVCGSPELGQVPTHDKRSKGWVRHAYLAACWALVRAVHRAEAEAEAEAEDHDIFAEGIDEVVRLGGDTDTNGAIAGALLGALLGHGEMSARARTRENMVALLEADVSPGAAGVDMPRPPEVRGIAIDGILERL